MSRLYGSSAHGVSPGAWIHHLGMCMTVARADAGVVNAVKGDLNMTSLALYNVAAEHPIRYMLGRDTRGWQVSLSSSSSDYSTAWAAAMRRGVTIDPALAFTALGYCIDQANIIVADLLPRLTGDLEIVFFGHGLAAGILTIIREKIRAAGKRAGFLFQSSAPRVLSERSAEGITLPSARLQSLSDAFTVAPPARVFTDWAPNPGPYEPLYPVGQMRLLPNTGTNRTRALIEQTEDGDAVSWTASFSETLLVYATPTIYLTTMWPSLRPHEQGESVEWFHLFKDTFGLPLIRQLS